MKILNHIIFAFLILGCTSNNNEGKENPENTTYLKFQIDDKKFKDQEINLSYTLDGKTIKINSSNNKIELPAFDSLMTSFQVEWNQYFFDLSGNFLKYELPNLLKENVETWHIKIDKHPFDNPNIPDSANINYIFMIQLDSGLDVSVYK